MALQDVSLEVYDSSSYARLAPGAARRYCDRRHGGSNRRDSIAGRAAQHDPMPTRNGLPADDFHVTVEQNVGIR